MRATALLTVLVWGCGTPLPSSDSGDARADPELDAGLDAEADGDADPDDGGTDEPRGGGPVTLVARFGVIEDRLCDLDGDGLGDNAIADLGSPASTVVANALNTLLDAAYGRRGRRLLIHIPWADDRDRPDDPDSVLLLVMGLDLDWPVNEEDDFSGEEPFYVGAPYLDGCGEPALPLRARLTAGALESTVEGLFLMPIDDEVSYALRRARIQGVVSPGARSFEGHACGVQLARDWGDAAHVLRGSDLSMLEVVLAGGAALGVPGMPGASPDIDWDADGLERFILDDESHIARCIDGDGVVIEGQDCWRDERIADGFSFTAAVEAVEAVCMGPEPGWQLETGLTCDEPPETSLWQGSCDCATGYWAMDEDLAEALSGVEVGAIGADGRDLGHTIPVLDAPGVTFAVQGGAALPDATRAWHEAAADSTYVALIAFDINAADEELVFPGTPDFQDSALLVRRAGVPSLRAVPDQQAVMRIDAAATAADMNLVRLGPEGVTADVGGPEDDGLPPQLVLPAQRVKEVLLEDLRSCD